MFDFSQLFSTEFLSGILGGSVLTGLLTPSIRSLWRDMTNTPKLKKWQSRVCAIVAGFILAIAWRLFSQTLVWYEIPAIVLSYALLSGIGYELLKKYLNKGE